MMLLKIKGRVYQVDLVTFTFSSNHNVVTAALTGSASTAAHGVDTGAVVFR